MLPYHGADIDFSISGKTAIITGGAAGIGNATARFFLEKGANVVLADCNPQTDTIAAALSPDRALGVTADILRGDDRQRIFDAACERFGQVDILVNCAGIVALDKAENLSEKDWGRTMDINLKGSFLMAQMAGRYFMAHKIAGCIVNMASQAGVIALDRHVAYCASKGAIIAMTKVLALEWGVHGIRVNAVSPTVVLTELGHKAWDGPVGDAFRQQIPGRRFAEPDEVAGAIAFLCSGAAGMITGHNLLIDGGYTIQ